MAEIDIRDRLVEMGFTPAKTRPIIDAYEAEIRRIQASDLISSENKKLAVTALNSALKKMQKVKQSNEKTVYFPEPFVFAESKQTDLTPTFMAEIYARRAGLSREAEDRLALIFLESGVFDKGESVDWSHYKLSERDVKRIRDVEIERIEATGKGYSKFYFKNPENPIFYGGKFRFGPDEHIGIDPMVKLEIAVERLENITEDLNSKSKHWPIKADGFYSSIIVPKSGEHEGRAIFGKLREAHEEGRKKSAECERLFESVTKGQITEFLTTKGNAPSPETVNLAFGMFMGMDQSKLSFEEVQILKDLQKPMQKFAKNKQMAGLREAMATNMAQERAARAVREINESIAMQKNQKNQAKLIVNNIISLHPNVAQHIRDFITETDRVRRADLMDRILFDVGHMDKNRTRELLEDCRFTLTHAITVEKPDLSIKTIQTEFGEINLEEILGEKATEQLQRQINAEIEEAVSKADVVEQQFNFDKEEDQNESATESENTNTGTYVRGPSETILDPTGNSTTYQTETGEEQADAWPKPIGNNLFMDEQGRIIDAVGTEYMVDETGALWGPDGKPYGQLPPQNAEEVDVSENGTGSGVGGNANENGEEKNA